MFSWQSVILLVFSYVVIPKLTFLPKNVHTLLIIFGPFLLPKLFNLVNTSRAASRSVPVRPVPKKVRRALILLFLSAVACLVLSFPRFSEENVFTKTSSRLQIEASTLYARMRLLRESTEEDEFFRAKFQKSMTNKLLYVVFGPDTLRNCLWCSTNDGVNDAMNYFLFSLPKILTPHIAHLAVLGLTTSSFIGPEGSRFRTHVTIAGLLLMTVETWYLGTYDITQNKRAKVLQEVDFVHWRVRFYRYIAFAAVDVVLGATLWLTSTNRWLAKPPSMAQRLETTTKITEEMNHKLRALGLVANSVNRDAGLRGLREEYWRTEGQVMAETVQDEEVVSRINRALASLDMKALEGQIGQVANGIVSAIDLKPARPDAPA